MPGPRTSTWSWLPAALSPRPARPRPSIDLGPKLPAWALRVALVTAAAGCTLAVASNRLHWVVAAALTAAMVVRPGSGAPAAFAVGVGLLFLGRDPDPFDPRVLLVVFGLHLTIELVTVTGDLPWSTTVERSVLVARTGPFLGIQAISQATALGGGALATGRTPAPWVALLAGVALAVLAWVIVLRLRPRP